MMSPPLHFLKVMNIKKEVVTKASHKHRPNFNDINVMKERYMEDRHRQSEEV